MFLPELPCLGSHLLHTCASLWVCLVPQVCISVLVFGDITVLCNPRHGAKVQLVSSGHAGCDVAYGEVCVSVRLPLGVR